MDIPITADGLRDAYDLGHHLHLDLIYHDHLSRDRDTAAALKPTLPDTLVESDGPRPWRMGPQFEGWPITEESLRHAQFLVTHSDLCPIGGEPFGEWYDHWTKWIDNLHDGGLRVGVVTHNRNLQALYSRREGTFDPALYDCVGPAPLSVHKFSGEIITPWDGLDARPGVWLVRHAETSFGT